MGWARWRVGADVEGDGWGRGGNEDVIWGGGL